MRWMKRWHKSDALSEAEPGRALVIAAGGVLFAVAAMPPVAAWLEATLVRHALLQVPMFVLSGVIIGGLIAGPVSAGPRSVGTMAVPLLLIAIFTLSFWMLPRWLDAARTDALTDLAKAVSLSLLGGVPLRLGWPRLYPVTKAFICANVVSMLAVLGWLYLLFPTRLCVNYLLSEQRILGQAMLMIAGMLGIFGAGVALYGAGGRRLVAIRGQEDAVRPENPEGVATLNAWVGRARPF